MKGDLNGYTYSVFNLLKDIDKNVIECAKVGRINMKNDEINRCINEQNWINTLMSMKSYSKF